VVGELSHSTLSHSQFHNAVSNVRTWSQHAAGDGPDARWGEAAVERKWRGCVACQVNNQQNGVSLKEGHENLLMSPSTLNWRPCTLHAATVRSKEAASRTLGLSLCNEHVYSQEAEYIKKIKSRRPSSSHLPAFPGCGDPTRGGERSRLDSQTLG